MAVIVVLREPASNVSHSYALGAAQYSVGYSNTTVFRQLYLFNPIAGEGWSWKTGDEVRGEVEYIVRVKKIDLVNNEPERCKLTASSPRGEPPPFL